MAEEKKLNETVGKRIREARKARGLSQEKLSELLGVSFQAVSSWETGRFIPDAEHLPALAKELDLSLDALFTEAEKKWELKPVNYDPEHMYTFVKGKAQAYGLKQTLAALPVMRDRHRQTGKKRWSLYFPDASYEVHPLTLACHALAMGLKDDDVLAACLLHDVVEDTGTTPEELKRLPLGDQVVEAVRLVSKNLYNQEKTDWEDSYYGSIRENPLACLVKCLDRVNNVAGMADGFDREWMIQYTEKTDRYYPELLKAIKNVPEWNDAAWLLQYQLRSLVETFKRML